jgi:hypothetical protein
MLPAPLRTRAELVVDYVVGGLEGH